MSGFLDGATALACCAVALFFVKFWRQSRDPLFAILATAFLAFAVNRAILSALDPGDETRTLVYGVRFVAFALIAVAIIGKNRPRIRRPRQGRAAPAEKSSGSVFGRLRLGESVNASRVVVVFRNRGGP